MDTHLKWLSPEQKEELLEMKKNGKSKKEIQAKVEHYLNHLEGDAKKEATQSLIGGCREILKYVIGEENTAELRSMKDSGATNEELKSKLHTFVDAVHDEHKKGYVDDFGPACMKLYGITSSRRRRDHRFTLESSLDTHLKWLNADQKEHLLQMKKDGKDKKEIQGKLMHYYEELDGDAKKQATENLIGGCREILKYVIGEEKTAELKSMKESGVSKDELKAKLHVFLGEVHDEEKKKYIDDFGPVCMKLYGINHSRMRRHRHHFTLESCMDTHLKWLNPEQKEALLQMKKDGKNKKEIQEKLMHYYEELEGDAKKQATENLISEGANDHQHRNVRHTVSTYFLSLCWSDLFILGIILTLINAIF
ncbi:unnamed protein product [Anisakis simplex]|uniref:SAP domain-containing protein n=1 Tax=Anisakis simplex TaxID=6269 RepID=A0A0M3K8L6_ANISI|nr:unnamed protein product [Anisakis simplex]